MAHVTKEGIDSPTRAFRSTRVVTPTGLRPATILIRGEQIEAVAPSEDIPSDVHLHDYGDLVLLPGLVDPHVHINQASPESVPEPNRTHWEGFATATRAAAVGGVTTLVDMPLNCVPETLSVATLEAKRAAATGQTYVDWMTWGGAVGNNGINGNESELPCMIAAGVPGFKCFLVHSGIDGFAWIDEPQLRKTLTALQGSGLPLLAHAELAGPVDQATAAINASDKPADWRSYATYLASRPDQAELEAIELLIALAHEFDAHIHIVHLATARALPALKQARESGIRITVETCAQYLHFAAEDIPSGATEYKCAPPIRSAANREALWQGLHEGIIDMIATDHSPCPPDLKHRETGRFDQAWGGISSLGLALPVIWTGLSQRSHDNHEKLALIAKWLSAEPAHLASLTGQKGALRIGNDADIVVFDPDALWTVTTEDLHFRHKLSPYLGAHLRGRVLETWLRGEQIYSYPSQNESMGLANPSSRGHELRRTS